MLRRGYGTFMSEDFNPLVSIVIPVYNGSNYLREAIDSALNQKYRNIEVLVINDGSNDNGATSALALSYGNKIRYFEKENGGVASALNLGIKEMRGEYFSWLSHDDVYNSNKIRTQIEYLRGVDYRKIVLYSDYCCIDEKSELISCIDLNLTDAKNFYYNLIMEGIHGCTLLIPKECFVKKGMFNEKLKTTQDYDLWFRFGEEYEFKHIPSHLVQYRLHSEQDSIKKDRYCLDERNNLFINAMNSINNKMEHLDWFFNFSKSFLKSNLYRASISALRIYFYNGLSQEYLLRKSEAFCKSLVLFIYIFLKYLYRSTFLLNRH